MSPDGSCDLAILGGGPGGYVAAIRATQLGLTVTLIERDSLGGVCVNTGCIPTKSLTHQARLFAARGELEDMGVTVDVAGLSWPRVIGRAREAARTLSAGVRTLLEHRGVTILPGTARLAGLGRVALDNGGTLSARNIIIATGSEPAALPDTPFDGKRILSSTDMLALDELPRSLVIIGGGYIGCEFAAVLSSFGVQVTLVEAENRLLPGMDSDQSKLIARVFKRQGVAVRTASTVREIRASDTDVAVRVETARGPAEFTADRAMVVIGRRPLLTGLGLETVGIVPDHGRIAVDGRQRTMAPGISAIGDVTGPPYLAHTASYEGEIAAEDVAGADPLPLDPLAVPGVIFTDPELAGFGLTVEAAETDGMTVTTGTFPLRGCGRAVAEGRRDGMAKLVFDAADGHLVGAWITGPEAGSLIHELAVARTLGATAPDIAHTIHAHPTWSEMLREAALDAGGQAINFL